MQIKNRIKKVLDVFFKRIPSTSSNDIKILSYSSLDPLGYVICFKQKIFRLIYDNSKSFSLELFSSGLIDDLIDSEVLVNSWISKYQSADYQLIIEHKRLNNITSFYWSFEMLKDAAITVLKCLSLTNKKGYTLIDGHYRNILFDNNTPKWIDIGSIIKNETGLWYAKKEFIYSFIMPLVFYKLQEYNLFSVKIYGSSYFMPQKELSVSFIFTKFKQIVATFYNDSSHLMEMSNEDFLNFLIKEVNIEWINKHLILFDSQTLWTDYQAILTNEHLNRYELISSKVASIKSAKSLIDLAGNTAQLSMCVRQKNKKIKLISTDYDMTVIDKTYNYLKNTTQNIEVYLFNFMITLGEVPADFVSDIAVAMAVTHHLLLSQGYKIDDILTKIRQLSRKYVFIEFMPLGLYGGSDELPSIPDWYNTAWFRENFAKYFHIIEESVTSRVMVNNKYYEHRILFFGRVR